MRVHNQGVCQAPIPTTNEPARPLGTHHGGRFDAPIDLRTDEIKLADRLAACRTSSAPLTRESFNELARQMEEYLDEPTLPCVPRDLWLRARRQLSPPSLRSRISRMIARIRGGG